VPDNSEKGGRPSFSGRLAHALELDPVYLAKGLMVGSRFGDCAGCGRGRFGGRSFRITDAMADSSRKLAFRRAGVSVLSSAFSIRRDRRATSDLSIARRS